ncbi:uncharacterized protein [Typha latifolia]|uniref:uncharacterized protein n=1 Tax=Typha latifolia TaxID=4733 RepID=UPI003C2BD9D6
MGEKGRETVMSLSDMVMGFFEEVEEEPWDNAGGEEAGDDDDDEEESRGFWQTQHRLLQEALAKSSSTEKRIRMDTEDAVRNMNSGSFVCFCSNLMAKEYCRSCTLRYITERLKKSGYNSALCKSKWRSSLDIPSGEHSYVDVVMESRSGKRSPVRVVVEFNFRAEFEMARASEEYNHLVGVLPEIFVGKSEKVKSVVKIMCAAAKRCMKDNKMHMAPWRKDKYMLSKWLSTPDRIAPGAFMPINFVTQRQPKSRASMLTFDLHPTPLQVA